MADSYQLWMSHDVAESIRRHGAETFPYECCGALLGRESAATEDNGSQQQQIELPREILELFPLVNRRDDSPRNRFAVTAEDVREAEKAASQHGLEVVGWYHSHPDHPARPSAFDREHAWPWYSYVIVSVEAGTSKDLTSWRLEDDRSKFEAEEVLPVRAASHGKQG